MGLIAAQTSILRSSMPSSPTRAFSSRRRTIINWARTGSLMWMTFGLACCAVG